MALKDLLDAAVGAVAGALQNSGSKSTGSSGGKSSGSSGKSSGSSGSGGYTPLDSSGNDYAGMVGMSDVDRAALDAASSSWSKAYEAGDQRGMDAAHQQAEALRAKYGYSGGADGSQYIPQERFTYEKAPSYTSKYQSQIDDLAADILGRGPFSYDPETDPLYQQYRESYTRSGQRAMQDTLGQVAARTGGLASSYAGAAAQQTYDNYMSALADKIPELQQLAYSMYMDEGDTMRQNLAMLQALESGDYAKYQDLLGQYNTDRSFAYDVFGDQRDYNYQLGRDEIADSRYSTEWQHQLDREAIDDSRYADETAYERETYADERDYARAKERAENLAAGGNFSGYKALGYSDDEIASMEAAWRAAQMLAMYSGSSGRSGGSSGSRSSSRSGSSGGSSSGYGGGGDYDALFAAAQNAVSPQNFISSNYKKYGFTSSSGLWNAYQEWAGNSYDSFNFDEDEGIFTWNGKNYTNIQDLQKDLDKAHLTPAQEETLRRKLDMFGFDS